MITAINNINSNPFLKKYVFEEKGYVEINDIYDRIEIVNIFVQEKYRNQQIASKLLEYVIKYAETNKKINITLEVNINNSIAIHLYKKYNFVEVAIRKGYYEGIDGLLMERKI